MEASDALDSRERRIAFQGARWWPQTVKQGGDTICTRFFCSEWKIRNEYNIKVLRMALSFFV